MENTQTQSDLNIVIKYRQTIFFHLVVAWVFACLTTNQSYIQEASSHDVDELHSQMVQSDTTDKAN